MMTSLTCPVCGLTRMVNRQTLWASKRRQQPGLCRPCSAVIRFSATRLRDQKPCGTCGAVKPLDEFYRCSSHRDGRSSRCSECSRRIAREYALANSAKAVERATRWARNNPERRLAIAREHARRFRKAHPERARQRKDRTDFDAILSEHGLVCHICRGSIGEGDLHFDHVIPLSRGGDHNKHNIRPAHARCNLRKGSRLLEEMS